ncbi:MAG: type II toxin-antitoxin system RelB/DinJ family antitoxin [Phascolarctobacterium sp.]|nr:type II toxin-antitoxin system RelB/DinJ family antitoxin [Phascolarctobacterium sp.]MBR6511108.1 type II toxin-antitoxin system RelB/DinJ family antitoxin [Phascolarctobacterium sp.]
MAQANVNIRMDAELKNNLDQLCNELGMTISTAVTIFAKAMVRNGGIPFDVRIATPNKETLEAFQEIEEMKKNPSAYKRYTNVRKMMEELLD